MDTDYDKSESPRQQMAEEPCCASATAQKILEHGAEAYGKAEQAVSDAYDKMTQKVSETYKKAKSYGSENPGTTILIALGIGVCLGLLLGASSRR